MTCSDRWESFYRSTDVPTRPSQFAAFCLGELDAGAIVDAGCGNGRDSLFFASQGIRTIGVDSSASAIAGCVERAGAREYDLPGVERVGFLRADVTDPGFAATLLERELAVAALPLLFYARFLLHSLSEAEEAGLLDSAGTLLASGQGILALEFRTVRDEGRAKETPGHYRRYIDPVEFISRAILRGFRVRYFVEGFGYAKYGRDDAHVARLLLTHHG